MEKEGLVDDKSLLTTLLELGPDGSGSHGNAGGLTVLELKHIREEFKYSNFSGEIRSFENNFP